MVDTIKQNQALYDVVQTTIANGRNACLQLYKECSLHCRRANWLLVFLRARTSISTQCQSNTHTLVLSIPRDSRADVIFCCHGQAYRIPGTKQRWENYRRQNRGSTETI